MNFTDLLTAVANAVDEEFQRSGNMKPVSFEFLREFVTTDPDLVSKIEIFRESFSPPTFDARFTLFDEREARHDDPVYVAQISYCAELEFDKFFLLYVLVKELMHCFDHPDTWINSPEKLTQFLRDLQNKPMTSANGSINVELKARWMAVVALAPPKLRQYIVESKQKERSLGELEQELGLPVTIVASALDEYYETALRTILEADLPSVEDSVPDPNLD